MYDFTSRAGVSLALASIDTVWASLSNIHSTLPDIITNWYMYSGLTFEHYWWLGAIIVSDGVCTEADYDKCR